MGLTEPADVNDLVSMDTVEAPAVAIVDHEMLVYDGKRIEDSESTAEGEVAFPGSL
jgi:hypothetical protein